MKKILTAAVIASLAVALFSGCKLTSLFDKEKDEKVAEEPVVEEELVTFLSEPEDKNEFFRKA